MTGTIQWSVLRGIVDSQNRLSEEEVEAKVKIELFTNFADKARKMAVLGNYSQNVHYWKDAGIKKLSYYGTFERINYPGGENKDHMFMKEYAIHLGHDRLLPEKKHSGFACVASIFTLPHFFRTRQTAQCLMKNVSLMLECGGHFICLYHNGSFIRDQLNTRPSCLYHSSDSCFEKLWEKIACFGSNYRLDAELQDSYLVFGSTLLALGREVGLEPVSYLPESLMSLLEEERSTEGLFRFKNSPLKSLVVFTKLK
jgi:hypothetical protein